MLTCPRCARDIPNDSVLCCYCGRSIVRKMPGKIHQRPNGSGTAYKRPGRNSWTAVYTKGWYLDDDGKKHRIRVTKGGFQKKSDALEYIDKLKQEQKNRVAPVLSEYWKLYSHGEMEQLSDSKQAAYTIAWGKMKAISTEHVDEITIAKLRDCVKKQAATYYPARDMKVLLSHLFRLAAADGFANKDLPTFINLPAKDEAEREIFTEEEQKALWKAYESGCQEAGIALAMIYTGMMPGEMKKLEGSMIDWDGNTIIGVGMKTKVRKESPVYFPDDIKPVLADLVAGKEGRIFSMHKTSLYDRYYKGLEVAGVRKLSPYSCRHTTATRLAITNTIAPQTVKKVMRWSTAKMLDRYAHPDSTDALAAIQTLNAQSSADGEKGSVQRDTQGNTQRDTQGNTREDTQEE